MSERCATCAFWREEAREADAMGVVQLDLDDDRLRTYDLDIRDPLTLEPVPPPFPIGQCVQPQLVQFARPAARHGLTVLDGSGYAAALVTGPDFGCVNYQRRDE